jgi:hypothetical protein
MKNRYLVAIPFDPSLSYPDDLDRCEKILGSYLTQECIPTVDMLGHFTFYVLCTEPQLTMLLLSNGIKLLKENTDDE